MATYKVTWAFRSQDLGWHETLYKNIGSAQLAIGSATSLAALRLRLTGVRGSCVISDIEAKRVDPAGPPPETDDTEQDVQNEKGPFAADLVNDAPWTAQLVSLSDNNGKKRAYPLRGLPDTVTKAPWNQSITDAKWRGVYDEWKKAILDGTWCIRAANAPDLVPIADLFTNLNGQIVVKRVAHGLVDDQRIRFYRVKTMAGCVRGEHRVKVVDADTFLIPVSNSPPFSFSSGSYYVPVFSYNSIADVELVRLTRRKTGVFKHLATNVKKRNQAYVAPPAP